MQSQISSQKAGIERFHTHRGGAPCRVSRAWRFWPWKLSDEATSHEMLAATRSQKRQGKARLLPLQLLRGAWLCWHLGLSPVILISDSWFPEQHRLKFVAVSYSSNKKYLTQGLQTQRLTGAKQVRQAGRGWVSHSPWGCRLIPCRDRSTGWPHFPAF